MPLNPATLDSETPETLDKRKYPDHLRKYESLDVELLPIAAQLGGFTFDDLAERVTNPRTRAAIPRWLASATWRELIKREDRIGMSSPRINRITGRGLAKLRT